MLIIIYLILAFLVGGWAEQKKLPFGKNFLCALLLSPLIGALVVGTTEAKED